MSSVMRVNQNVVKRLTSWTQQFSGSDCVEIKLPLLSLRQLEVITHTSSPLHSPDWPSSSLPQPHIQPDSVFSRLEIHSEL